MANYYAARIGDAETVGIIFTAIVSVNGATTRRAAFGTACKKLPAEQFRRVQELAVEIMEIVDEYGDEELKK